MSNDLVVQLGAKLDQFQSDMNSAGDMADGGGNRYVGGISEALCELPAGWDKIASENWRALQSDIATRKFLGSNLQKPSQG
jgi:hypothetical protein